MIKQLRIGPVTYRVVEKKLNNAFGQLDRQSHVISFDPKYCNTKKERYITVLHEALHGITDQSGINQVLADDELVVRIMENFICILLKDNPEFTRELVKSL